MTTATYLTQADLTTILASYGATAECREGSFCHKHGTGYATFAFALRTNGTRVLLGMWEVIRALSEGKMRELVESKLREVTV